MRLPDLKEQRVGPALCVVHGVLYCSGGVDEHTHEFTGTVERYVPGPTEPREICGPESRWETVPGLKMPVELHAHSAHGLPVLNSSLR